MHAMEYYSVLKKEGILFIWDSMDELGKYYAE